MAINYHGRKTSRNSSEQRRLSILRAALRVVVRDGVRGVRHRAVAAEAGVPLSATTYYFKDIHDLLTDAFTLYVQETIENFVDPFWARANEWLNQFTPEQLQASANRAQILETLADMGAAHILETQQAHHEQLNIEYAFLYAALLDERLHSLALQYGQRLLAHLSEALARLGVSEVELSAKAMLALIRRLQYEALVGMPEASDLALVKKALQHQMTCLVGCA